MLTLHGLCLWTTLCLLHLKHTLVGNYVLAVQQRKLIFFLQIHAHYFVITISNVFLLRYTKY